MTQRLFTPGEANKTLPLVRKIVADILEKGKEMRESAKGKNPQEAGDHGASIDVEIQALMKELEQVGCFYKDWNFDSGLVDFPGEIDGKKVFLCWKSDEESVSWYHPIEGGFAKRAPIPPELLSGDATGT